MGVVGKLDIRAGGGTSANAKDGDNNSVCRVNCGSCGILMLMFCCNLEGLDILRGISPLSPAVCGNGGR